MSDGTTIGVWIGDGDTVVKRFDNQLGDAPDYSRSNCIKDAMELYLAVDEVLDEFEYEFDAEASKRHWVRQAVRDLAVEETIDD